MLIWGRAAVPTATASATATCNCTGDAVGPHGEFQPFLTFDLIMSSAGCRLECWQGRRWSSHGPKLESDKARSRACSIDGARRLADGVVVSLCTAPRPHWRLNARSPGRPLRLSPLCLPHTGPARGAVAHADRRGPMVGDGTGFGFFV